MINSFIEQWLLSIPMEKWGLSYYIYRKWFKKEKPRIRCKNGHRHKIQRGALVFHEWRKN